MRSKDSYQVYVEDFLNSEILVACPHCHQQAFVKPPAANKSNASPNETRLICMHCGHSKQSKHSSPIKLFATAPQRVFGKYLLIGAPLDPYFQLPLWLVTDCCGQLLWTYNHSHLSFLKEHVAAGLRERNTVDNSNQSMGSRLPRWMTSKKNRETVLKAIEQLQCK